MRAGSVEHSARAGLVRAALLEPFGFARPPEQVPIEAWDAIVAAAEEHRLLGALRRGTAIESIGVPDHALEAVRTAYFRSLTRHLKYVELLRTIAAEFEDERIRWAVVKGPILAETVYESVDLRSYSDLDLLIHPGDVERAVVLLERRGGEVFERNWSLMTRMQRGELQVNLPGPLFVDVHWHLLIDPALRRQITFDTVELLARARPVSLSGVDVPALDPTDAFVHLVVHAVLAGAHRLRWSLDVEFAARCIVAPPDEVMTRVDATRTTPFVEVMRSRVRRLLGPGAGRWPGVPTHRGPWPAAIAGYDTVRQPERWFGQAASGRLLLAATRPTLPATAAALGRAVATAAREVTADPHHRWRRSARVRSASTGRSPILDDDPDLDARRRFFEMARTASLS